jgi:hypothetical protein
MSKDAMEEGREIIEHDIAMLKEASPEDFRDEVIEQIRFIREAILDGIDFTSQQCKFIAETVGGKFEQINSVIEIVDGNFKAAQEEIGTLQHALLFAGIRLRTHLDGPMPYDEKKGYAESLSIDFDELAAKFKEPPTASHEVSR